MPCEDVIESGRERPPRSVIQARLCLRNIQFEVVALVRLRARIGLPMGVRPPGRCEVSGNPGHGSGVFVLRAKIPRFRIRIALQI